MIRALARFAIRYPITVTMGVCAVLLLGGISFRKLGMDLFPDLNNPRIFVQLKSGERPPEEIEKQFLTSIEAQAIRQKGVMRVSSVARTGGALITVEYAWNTRMDEAFLELQKALRSFSGNQNIDEFTVTQQDPNAAPVVLLGFGHPEITDMDELRRVAETSIRNELVRLDDIAEVELLGGEEKEVLIQTDDYRLKAYGVTASTLTSQITSYNRNVSGGTIVEMGTSYVIKGVGELANLDDIGGVIVSYKTESQTSSSSSSGATSTTTTTTGVRVPVYLRDVATIELRNKDPENIVRVNGKRCMGIAVYKETRANTVSAVNEFFKALDQLKKTLPGYQFTVIQDQGRFVSNSINEVKQAALIGVILAIFVLFIFLRRFASTLIISLAIPISIIATFTLMYFNGLTLNIMTLGGLALGAGMLVDNAIIVMESIFRNLENAVPLREASIEGTAQVGAAINASTITTIIVFLPIVYLHGAAGILFKDQAWTVAFSLLSSLVVAVLVIPMLAEKFLKSRKALPTRGPVRYPRYRAMQDWCINHRWPVIGSTVFLVGISFLLIPKIGSEFLPEAGARNLTVDIRLPEGTELMRTADAVASLEGIARGALGSGMRTIYSVIGPSSLTGESGTVIQDENTATIRITLADSALVTIEDATAKLTKAFAKIPDAEINIRPAETALDIVLGTTSAPLSIEISGDDLEILKSLTDQVRGKISGIPDLSNIRTSFDEGRPEIEVVLDRERAGVYNVGISNLSSQLTERLSGTSAGDWDNGGELRSMTVKLPKVGVGEIGDLIVRSGSQEIPVSEVASIRVSRAPSEIHRKNQARIGTVDADLIGKRPLDHVVLDIRAAIAGMSLPSGYRFNIGGEEERRREAFGNLKFALILSIVLMYMVLAAQFESLVHPFTILLSVPTAVTGTLLLFFALGKPLTITAYIGVIMLVGIAVNDSIVLMDAVLQLRRAGMNARDAVLEAGQRRLRPILMTTLTTLLGMLPLTFGFGEGTSLRAPMALAVIGGLLTSTLLTLVVIPSVYFAIERMLRRELSTSLK